MFLCLHASAFIICPYVFTHLCSFDTFSYCVSSYFHTSLLILQVTDSFNWLQSSLDTMVSRCINRIHGDGLLWLTAPPPPTAAPSNSTTISTTVSATRHPLTIGEKLLNNICPSGCSQKGRCVQRKCQCSTGYTGVDCSIRIHSAPQVWCH